MLFSWFVTSHTHSVYRSWYPCLIFVPSFTACTRQPPLVWVHHLLSRGSFILEGTWWCTLHNSDERSTLPSSSSSDFPFLSLTRSLALSSHTASVTTEGCSLQGTLACYCCWVGLNETHSKDVFAVALRAIPATWRSLWLLFFEAWSACLSNLKIKPGGRSMPGS